MERLLGGAWTWCFYLTEVLEVTMDKRPSHRSRKATFGKAVRHHHNVSSFSQSVDRDSVVESS